MANSAIITRDLTITVSNDRATLSEPLTIYRNNRGIQLNLKIVEYKFNFNRATEENLLAKNTSIIYSRVLVHKPSGKGCFDIPLTNVKDDTVIVLIDKSWTDDLDELDTTGPYQLQVLLYGEDPRESCVAIPPVNFVVKDLICDIPEDLDNLPDAVAGKALATYSLAAEGNGDEYNSDYAKGEYNFVPWSTGDLITSNSLNKIEDAVNYSIQELADVYRKDEVDLAIKNVEVDAYTKAEIDERLQNMVEDAYSTEEIDTMMAEQQEYIINNVKGEQGIQGEIGPRGYTFSPNMDAEGNLTWTNDGDLANPSPINLVGPQGEQGIQGEIGPRGYTFLPNMDSEGNLSWTNDGELINPMTLNLVGPQGPQGIQGPIGQPLNIKGRIGSTLELINIEEKYIGDSYVIGQNIYLWDGDEWVDLGNVVGPQGIQGPKGDSIDIVMSTEEPEDKDFLWIVDSEMEEYVTRQYVEDKGYVSSGNINRIEVVAQYPDIMEEGVMYVLVVED